MTAETAALTDELHAANEKLDLVLGRFDDLNRRHLEERHLSRWHRLGSALLGVLVLAVIVLGVSDAQQRAADEEARCLSANRTRADIRGSIVESLLVIAAQGDDPNRLDEVVERIHARLSETIPDTPC